MGILGLFKLLGKTLAATSLLCWALTTQSFMGPVLDFLLFAGGTLSIAFFSIAAIEELDR
ncbi:MAG TPA: hypothetical protein V6C78_16485 [Crinalium sp.]|jgi:hypothetical protein